MRSEYTLTALNHALGRAFRIILTAILVIGGLVAIAAPAHADTTPPVIPPGPERDRWDRCNDPNQRNCNNPDIWIDYTCKNGNLTADGRLYIKNDPRCMECPDKWWDESKCDWTWDYYTTAVCLVRFEVFRFYGPRSNPTKWRTRSHAYPRFDCKEHSPERFIFHAPHPHDAGVYGGAPFASSGMFTTTSWPISGAGQCPVGDDPARLARFWGPQSSFKTPEEKEAAKKVRQGLGNLFKAVRSELSARDIPSVYAYHFMNAKANGLYTYPGDDFQTIRYPDGVPCSSGLDFVVPEGQDPLVYGVCWVPIVTAETVKYRNSRTDEEIWRIKHNHKEEVDVDWINDPKNQGASTDSIVRQYRLAIPREYLDNPNPYQSNIPCHYGEGSVFANREGSPPPPKATPVSFAPASKLAYIYGDPGLELEFEVHKPTLTCAPKTCAAGTEIIRVKWNKPTVKTPTGSGSWAACSSSNRTYCAYTLNSQKAPNNSLAVQFRGYKATPANQAFQLSFSGTADIKYVIAHEQTLEVRLGRNWTGLNGAHPPKEFFLSISQPQVEYARNVRIQFPNGNTTQIKVAGSRLVDK